MSKNYVSPFSSRYASGEMSYLFSDEKKFTTWRKLWIALAKAERKLGLPISEEQIEELEANVNNLNLETAAQRERLTRHDVMSHVYAYGEQCPRAKAIIHLGATSCYVGDNTDIIIMREALQLIRGKLLRVIKNLSEFALLYKDMPALAYTHLQPAQLTTVGKRACLWISDLMSDIAEIDHRIASLRLLGSKGTTGTQASFLELFEGNHQKCKELEGMIAAEMGFEDVYPVTGQTYSRKVDSAVLQTLSQIAQSAYKFSNDLRLLQNFKEMEEPFEKGQIGSSAMPYKRNPMRSERMGSIARHVIINELNPAITASTQWFERTLDDSANKRISVAEAFLGADAVLSIYMNISSGLVVYPKIIRRRIMDELPFMASENIMMKAVLKGGDRQELHERIRVHAQAAAKRVKEDGAQNDLIDRIAADPVFKLGRAELDAVLAPELYTGRSERQVVEYIEGEVRSLLDKSGGGTAPEEELNV